jgi:methylphosphotriester-DNA--protein-cysteine methyltransferase
MNRALLALLLAASVALVAQESKAKAGGAKAKTAEATKAAPATKPAASGALVANKDSKTYHRADCKSAAKIKEANRASFTSAAEADKAGYKACKICKP